MILNIGKRMESLLHLMLSVTGFENLLEKIK